MGEVAIIGAGLSGLACARRLVESGVSVALFDKGRQPGGRVATRRRRSGFRYDHGAQYFTVEDPCFAEAVADWRDLGIVAEWRGRIVAFDGTTFHPTSPRSRFVGVPGMQALPAHLARGLELRNGCRVESIAGSSGRWELVQATGRDGPFRIVVVAVPAGQAAPLLDAAPTLRARTSAVAMEPCHAAMLSFDGPLTADFDGAFVNRGPLSWIARDGGKPGRSGEGWVLHSTPSWSASHWEDAEEDVVDALTAALAETLGASLPAIVDRRSHRWRFARPIDPLPERSLFDESAGLAACGDWCGGPRVEGAFLSGQDLAERILRARVRR